MQRHEIAKQYEQLKTQKEQLELRLSILRNQLINAYSLGTTFEEGLEVERQLRDCTSLDELEAANLLTEKGMWNIGTKRVVDPQLIEQLYLEGNLTDGDLRRIRKPDFREVVKVRCIDQDNTFG